VALDALIDRQDELAGLERAWKEARSGSPQLAVVWGRRRVGKTFLLSHFAQGKRAVFFGATQQAEAIELARFGEAIERDLGVEELDLAGGGFGTWEAVLRYLAARARERPLLAILDEVPYLARSTKGFASIVQNVWDHLRKGTKLMLVLTGSAVGTVESMLGPGPLRGRPTRPLRLDPLDPVRAKAFLPRLRPADFLEAYAACGGYPLHLKRWDQSVGTEANLFRLAGKPGEILLEDAASILQEELPDIGGYPAILAAIGRGRTRRSEIMSETDQRVDHPLSVLIRAGFVRRAVPVGAPRAARPFYEIADPYLAFWFAVLYSDLAQIEAGQGRAVLQRRKEQWQRHLGWVFEEAARDHAIRLALRGELPGDMVIGRWWTTTGEPTEIDVLGLRRGQTYLLGEARWQSRPLGHRDLNELIAKAARSPRPVEEPTFAMWGRGGVAGDVLRPGVLGFDAEDVLSS
jgi:uncharacterized protein